MDVKKSDIIWWTEKVQSKAIKSVKDRYAERRNALLDKAFSQKDFVEIASQVQSQLETLVALGAQMFDVLKTHFKAPKELETHYRYERLGNLVLFFGLTESTDEGRKVIDYKSKIIKNSDVLSIPGLCKVIEEEEAEVKEVRNAYTVLISTLKSMNSPKKMISYLDELGFDTSSINPAPKETPKEIDKSKLFVCGDNK